ncbi:hypothetical protein GSH19_04140 [Lactobacillus sp. S2-2]|uniref:CAP domain-containing protein n=1 Tax=Lactobacillus sp. S2-2 TaxID=2692917 RepID=UPI001F26C3B3|nr:CAP domain-containing protein [Lactobacillus sp. S2-2]MCF6515345.1 hypothetical protein [Lactobacillus sp. S2-2]
MNNKVKKQIITIVGLVVLSISAALIVNINNIDAKSSIGYTKKVTNVYKNKKLTKKVASLKKNQAIYYGKIHVIKNNGQTIKVRYIKKNNSKVKGYILNNKIKYSKQVSTNKSNKKLSVAEFQSEAAQAAFKLINMERAKRNLSPLTSDDQMNELAQRRSAEIQSNFSHYDKEGHALHVQEANQMNISYSYIAECIGYSSGYADTPESFAKTQINAMIYDDAASDWGHRDILLNPESKYIGVGVTVKGSKETLSVNIMR